MGYAPHRLLLVESDPEDQEIFCLAMKLSGLDCELEIASDGAQAAMRLFYTMSSAPDLNVIDLNVSKINGLDLLKMMMVHEITKHVPLIVTSSEGNREALKLAQAFPRSRFVCKEPDPLTYTAKMASALREGLGVSYLKG